MHMLVQAGAKAVDEGDCANMHSRFVYLRRTRAMGSQAVRNRPQEDAQHPVQHCPIALHKVTQPVVALPVKLACVRSGWRGL